ncbi:Rieske (2Fe-2S) protein [Pedobacter cryotolerans]|uniref:Rieske (2Fe-2S) protein n=1 Tax=Pedobacter cryotolerans TaxID=2571270 RepID=A0A4U1C7Z0_9SPHI|nr:Rieske (2Fe-2S) protein [Pedobacter cryotolerans]TKC02452.1 Rieske (2Fe-2S) protein [Pedobacter cryotolerans]
MIWVKVLSKQEAERDDFVEMAKVEGKKICIVKHKGNFAAIQNTCPHAGGILSGGWCKEGHIICPIHRYGYNLETGRGYTGQGDYIDVYPLELREDGLYIGFRQSWIKRLFS